MEYDEIRRGKIVEKIISEINAARGQAMHYGTIGGCEEDAYRFKSALEEDFEVIIMKGS